LGDLEDGGHVVAKVEFLERCFDVLACNRLLRVLFGNLVGFGRDEGDELDAAFNQEIARVFGKSHAGLAGQDILDNLLYSRWGALAVVRVWGGRAIKWGGGDSAPFGSDKSSLPPNSRSDMVVVVVECAVQCWRWACLGLLRVAPS